jgi:predicted flavoprotein YhiN
MLRGMDKNTQTPLVIVGAGAAGLMAAAHAGERGVPVLLLERKHRAGSKVLMCGNGRCNLTSCLDATTMLSNFGAPLDDFLRPAISTFAPNELQAWFERQGLPVMQTRDGKVFPKSERAPDVVKCFINTLRRYSIPICYNAPVEKIQAQDKGFSVITNNFQIEAQRVLIATGGVSYPKTGSVGDGQKLARTLGHRVTPYRPGLVGIAWEDPWVQAHLGEQFKAVRVRVLDGSTCIGETKGLLECERWGLGGGAISNATRLLSRHNAQKPGVEITYAPRQAPLRINHLKMRPLKEAMVTVGGVDLADNTPKTMETKTTPGIYFAGEVLDVDGPTGGYNLTAAFAAARLVINAIATEAGFAPTQASGPPQQQRRTYKPDRRKPDRRKRPQRRPRR